MTHVLYGYILVRSNQQAIQIEHLLMEQKLTCKLIPVPREISSQCGVCIRILRSNKSDVLTLLKDQHITYREIE
jgi:hypothetical protein